MPVDIAEGQRTNIGLIESIGVVRRRCQKKKKENDQTWYRRELRNGWIEMEIFWGERHKPPQRQPPTKTDRRSEAEEAWARYELADRHIKM